MQSESGIRLKRYGNNLAPADREARELIEKLPHGKELMATVKAPRNASQHRLLWRVARLVADNRDEYQNAEHAMEQIKIGTGHSVRVRLVIPDVGEVDQVRGKSIAFESMGQVEFAAFFDRALDYIVTVLMPGVTVEDIRREIAL